MFDETKGKVTLLEGDFFVENGVLIDYIGNSETLVIPETMGGRAVTTIGESCFYGCNGLKSVTIPDSVVRIESWAFSCCEELEHIYIPESVNFIGPDALYGTPWFTNLSQEFVVLGDGILMKYNGDGGEVVIPFAVDGKAVTSIGEWVFAESESITSVEVPDSVRYIGAGAFAGCENLEKMALPQTIDFVGDRAFWETAWYLGLSEEFSLVGEGICIKYNGKGGTVVVPDTVKSIGCSAFLKCDTITSVKIPESVEYMGENVFSDCSSLLRVTLPEGFSMIESWTFVNCHNLENVEMPSSMIEVSEEAFVGCDRLLVSF